MGLLSVFPSLLIVWWFGVPLRGSPLRYYMDVILGVFLKAAGIVELWPQAVALLVIGVVLFGIALSVFRRQLT